MRCRECVPRRSRSPRRPRLIWREHFLRLGKLCRSRDIFVETCIRAAHAKKESKKMGRMNFSKRHSSTYSVCILNFHIRFRDQEGVILACNLFFLCRDTDEEFHVTRSPPKRIVWHSASTRAGDVFHGNSLTRYTLK